MNAASSHTHVIMLRFTHPGARPYLNPGSALAFVTATL